MKTFIPSLIITSVLSFVACRHSTMKVDSKTVPYHNDTVAMLPNGWKLTPAGKSIPLGDFPMNMVLSHHGDFIAVTNNGQGVQSIELIDVHAQRISDSIAVKAAWLGLKFSNDDRFLYASGGNQNNILRFQIVNGKLKPDTAIHLGQPWPKEKISVAGIELDDKRQLLYAVTRGDSALYICDLKKLKVRGKIKLPDQAYNCVLLQNPTQPRLYISIWGKAEVAVYDLQKNEIINHIKTGSHPNDMVISHNQQNLYVANANSNTVSVIDIGTNKVIETISTTLYPTTLAGSTSNAVGISEDDKLLFVANADNNCVAVLNVERPGHSQPLGFIPTGWYPTSVKVWNDKIYVINGKGNFSSADPKGPNPYLNDSVSATRQYIGNLFTGTLSIIDFPDPEQMVSFSRQVIHNSPFKSNNEVSKKIEAGNPIPIKTGDASPINYVFYIIRENRTYDQVLGDLPEGNGDSTLCLFPKWITPNNHALASQFVLLDNFYVNAEVSADGHNWSMAAYATDYVEKTWPTLYGGRGGVYDFEGDNEIVEPDAGYIWDYCERAKISYRSYGEFVSMGQTKQSSLMDHAPSFFPTFDMNIMDTTRERLWERDFDSLLALNAVPHFQIIRLPNDHTSGSYAGARSPRACVADNDLATGKFIEHLSHSKIWNQSVVFILEDDAQDGPDHIDAHRSTAYIVGPYAKRKAVIHTMYSTAAILRTRELIVGLPPMSQYDAAAVPMYDCFSSHPDVAPYTALPEGTDLSEKNPVKGKLAELSARIDLTKEDRVPDDLFSEIIWKAVRGENSEMPAPRHAVFLVNGE